MTGLLAILLSIFQVNAPVPGPPGPPIPPPFLRPEEIPLWFEAGRLLRQAEVNLLREDRTYIEQALEMARRAEQLFKQLREQWGLGMAARAVSRAYTQMARHAEATEAARIALDAARAINDPQMTVTALNLVAMSDIRSRHLEEAFLLLRESYELTITRNLPGLRVQTCCNLGILHNTLGQPRQALVYLDEGIRFAADPGRISCVTRELGVSSFQLGEYEKALQYFEQALRLMPQAGLGRAIMHNFIADAQLRLRRFDLAEEHARRALEIATRVNNPDIINGATGRLAAIALARGNDEQAEVLFRKVLGSGPPEEHGNFGLGKVYEYRGELETALEFFEKAVEGLERLRSNRAAGEDRLSIFDSGEEVYQKPLDMLIRLHLRSPQNYAERAFQASERIRNHSFVEQLTTAWTRNNRNAQSMDQRLLEVEEQLNSISRTLVSSNVDPDQQRRLRAEFGKLELEHASTRRKMEIYNSLRAASLTEWTVSQVQNVLPPNIALLQYSAGNPPAVFVVTRDEFRLLGLPNADALDQRIPVYADLLSRASEEGFGTFEAAGSHALYKDLVEPALAGLSPAISHLIISPAGILNSLPYEALYMEPTGRFLVEKFSVSYIPSARVLSVIAGQKRDTGRKTLLAFANMNYEYGSKTKSLRSFFEAEDFVLGPLPYTATEVEAVVRTLGSSDAEVFIDATEARLKSTDLTKYRILHFAAHAVANKTHSDRSALVFSLGPRESDDGFLQVREIHDLRMNADLVTLSACRTAGGFGNRSDGVQGLSRAFFFAGARSVVSSLWMVEDKSTSELMTHFYRYLREGLSKAESLRRAKMALIEQGAHPQQWAGFILIGEPMESMFASVQTTRINYTWFLIAGALVAGALFWLLKRLFVQHPRHAGRPHE